MKETLHRCQNALAQFYLKLKFHQRALKLLDEALATAKSLKTKVFECEYLLSKGHILLLMNQAASARRIFKKASVSKSPVEEDIQAAYEKLNKTTDICKVLKAIKKHQEQDSGLVDGRLLKMYDMLGDFFSELDAYSVAVEYYAKELEAAKQMDLPASKVAPIIFSVAQTYLDDKNYEKALEFFQEELGLRAGNQVEETRTTLKIIETQIAQNKKVDHIIQLYEDAVTTFSGSTSCQRRILKDYSSYLHQELESEKAARVDQMLKDLGNSEDENETLNVDNCEEDDLLKLEELSSPSTDDSSENNDSESETRCLANNRPKRQKLKRMKTNELGETPLHRACIEGNHKEVVKLLEKGHPVNPRDHCGWLPIHEAANHGYSDICWSLIENGASINDPGGEKCGGTTPLHDACSNCQPKVIQVLVSKGADVTLLDTEGNTPVDCLRSWKARVADLSPEEEDIYEDLVTLLEDKMRDAGFDINAERKRPLIASTASLSPEKETSRRSVLSRRRQLESPSASPVRKKISRERDLELDYSNPNVARTEYQAAISRFRRPRDKNREYNKKDASDKPGLLLEEERVDDWLEDDLATTNSESMHDLYTSNKLPQKMRNPSSVTESDSRRAPKKKLNQESRRTFEDDGVPQQLPREYDDSPEVECLIVRETVSKEKPSAGAEVKSKQQREKILVKVRFEDGKCFLLRVPTANHKIEWLIQETVERYYEMEKKKPEIHLATGDGAFLSSHDLITDVIVDGEVHAKIRSFETLSLNSKYSENCKRNGVDPLSDMQTVLSTAEASGLLDLSHCMVSMSHVPFLLEAIESSEKILCVDFSFTDLTTSLGSEGKKQLLRRVLPSLPNLTEVRLRGSGMHSEDVVRLSEMNIKMSLLDLSYNSLGDSCIKRLFSTPAPLDAVPVFPWLNTLRLIGCDLSSDVIRDEGIREWFCKMNAVLVVEEDDEKREETNEVGWVRRHKWKKMRRENRTQKGVTPQVPSLSISS